MQMDSSNLSDISMRQYNQQEIKQNKDIQKEIEGMKEIECFLNQFGFLWTRYHAMWKRNLYIARAHYFAGIYSRKHN